MLDQITLENAQSCMSQVADVEALVAAFYDKLFATHPEVRGMFADDMSAATVFCSTVTFSILMLRVAIIMILTFTSFRA